MDFQPFPKMPRFNREIIITEKIDGTNASVLIDEDGNVQAASRKRLITPEDDNFGFAAWVKEHEDELRDLGPGQHFGEWWGKGIQRGYGLDHKRFSLFNVNRWHFNSDLPECCHVVPLLAGYDSPDSQVIQTWVRQLATYGSYAAPNFMKPEGIVIYHKHSNQLFKITLENDEKPKSQVA